MTALAVLGIAAPSAVDWPTKLIWNATASARIGFYIVEPADAADVPELVAVMPPEPLSAFMAERGYIGPGLPLLKRVVGLPGQRVCRIGRATGDSNTYAEEICWRSAAPSAMSAFGKYQVPVERPEWGRIADVAAIRVAASETWTRGTLWQKIIVAQRFSRCRF